MRYLLIFLLAYTIPNLAAATVDVYFGTNGDNAKGIYHSKFDTETGKLAPPTLAAEIGTPGFLALHPDKTRLYAVGRNSEGQCVAAYRIEADGGLTHINDSLVNDDGAGGTHLAVHPSGKFLVTAQYGGGSVAVFPLSADGSLKKRTQLIEHEGGSGINERRQSQPHPHWAGFSPDGRFAFIPDLGLDQIVIYSVDENASSIKAHGIAQSVRGGGPRHMRFSVDGRYIYLLNEMALSVTTFEYNSNKGTTKRLTTTPTLSEAVKAKEVSNSSSEIIVHPNGRFLYSGNRGNDSVTAYRANPDTGELSVIEVEPVRGAWPRNINMDSNGKWLLAAGRHSNTISVFDIDQKSGELTHQRQSTINVPAPVCILFAK